MSAICGVLRQLDEWRHLPAYQLERRVDIFFGMFLPKVIENRFDVCVKEVIPEFPLHKGLFDDKSSLECGPHRSVKVDFAVFGTKGDKKQIFLVELKTDMGSLDFRQLKNMKKVAQDVAFEATLSGVIELAKHSPQKRKYAHLIWTLHKLKCLELCNRTEFTNMRLEEDGPRLKSAFKNLCVGKEWCDACVDVVAILPWGREELNSDPEIHSISFSQFADILEIGYKPFVPEEVHAFVAYVRNWAHVRAGRVTPWPQQR